MNTNIPLYRAKKIGSEEYVIGYLLDDNVIGKFAKHPLLDNKFSTIDPSTRSIHFPDMLANDSDRLLPNGDKDLRIFASLSEDGKGGDILLLKDWDKGFENFDSSNPDETRVVLLKDFAINVMNIPDGSNCNFQMVEKSLCEIIGIKQ